MLDSGRQARDARPPQSRVSRYQVGVVVDSTVNNIDITSTWPADLSISTLSSGGEYFFVDDGRLLDFDHVSQSPIRRGDHIKPATSGQRSRQSIHDELIDVTAFSGTYTTTTDNIRSLVQPNTATIPQPGNRPCIETHDSYANIMPEKEILEQHADDSPRKKRRRTALKIQSALDASLQPDPSRKRPADNNPGCLSRKDATRAKNREASMRFRKRSKDKWTMLETRLHEALTAQDRLDEEVETLQTKNRVWSSLLLGDVQIPELQHFTCGPLSTILD